MNYYADKYGPDAGSSYSGTYGRLSNEEARQAEWAASAAAEADNKRRQEELANKMNELGLIKADIIAYGRIIDWDRVTKEIKNDLEERRTNAKEKEHKLEQWLDMSDLKRVNDWASRDTHSYNQLIAEPAIKQLIVEAMAEEEAARKAAAKAAAEEAEAQEAEAAERADNSRRLAMSQQQQQQQKKSSWFGFGSRPTPVVTTGPPTPKSSLLSRMNPMRWFGTKKSGGSKGRKSSSSKKTRRSRR